VEDARFLLSKETKSNIWRLLQAVRSNVKRTSQKLDMPNPMPNDEALVKCRAALELRDKGDYVGARETMLPLWRGVGHQPDVKGLEPPVGAEFLLAVGILTSWLGSKEGIEKAQEVARELIGEAIKFYESVGDVKMVAASQAEIAYCYFREGALNEARTMLTKALQILYAEGNTRARALLKLATVEWSASRYNVALGILVDNQSLFNKIPNHTTRGNYHNELAIVLRNLATAEKRELFSAGNLRIRKG
jgi:tetratricopeptide (TPR) repeat protein